MTRLVRGLLRALVALLLGAVVAVTGVQQLGSEGPWWLELTRYLPYPVALAPALLALLLSWPLGRRWRLAAAATVVWVATVAMGLAWHAGARSAASVRVMTYNTKAALALERPGGVEAIVREVAEHHPDIVVMQDANGIRHWRGFEPGKPLFGLPHVYAEGQYVVASRLPLRDCGQVRLETGGEPLAYASCIVAAAGAEFQLVDVHFESPRSGLVAARREGFYGIDSWQRNHAGRLAQAHALARALGGVRPIVVAGDLNAPQSSAVVGRLLATGLRDAFASAGRGYGYTYGHTLRPAISFLRIDHILVSAEFEVSDCFVGGAGASDHRPVIADLVLPAAVH